MSKDRLPFSVAYFGSLGLTLYFALGVRPVVLSTTRELTDPEMNS